METQAKPITPLEPVYEAVYHRDYRALLQYASVAYGEDAAFVTKHMVKDLPDAGADTTDDGETATQTDYQGAGHTDNRKYGQAGKRAVYRDISFRKYRRDVEELGTGLLAGTADAFANAEDMTGVAPIKPGSHIAIIGINSYPWFLSYMTVLNGLGICVPLDKGLPYEELENSIDRSHTDVLIFDRDHRELADRLATRENAPVLICMDEKVPMGASLSGETAEEGDVEGPMYPCIWDIMAYGKQQLAAGNEDFLNLPIDPEETALLIFTSGTTSLAKAVMLSQKNVLNNVYILQQTENIMHGDTNMAFLPYHHTFGASGQLLILACGATTVFCDGLKYVQKNMVEYGISVFVGVPLLIEAMYKKIMREVEKQGKTKTFVTGQRIAGLLGKVRIDVRRKLFKQILDQLGGKLRFVVTGAAALDPEVAKGFESLGVTVTQGYGMTECSPVIAAENHYNRKPGSIGKPMPGTKVIIANPDEEGVGEMWVQSDSVMAGYYEQPEETAEALVDGWLHTGDLAKVDEDGFIFIQGRAKNVIVLKNGKNVYPEEMELLIANLPYVEENMVYAEPRHAGGDEKDLALVARIYYNKDTMAADFGAKTPEEVSAVIKEDLDRINEQVPVYKRILRHEITDEPMEKTTTGKVKRYRELSK